jgi:hypothetical protein
MGWLQVDHVQPAAKGGSDDFENLCLADALYTHVAGNSIVVVYDPEASQHFRAFYNVCLHRAGPLAVKGVQHNNRPRGSRMG